MQSPNILWKTRTYLVGNMEAYSAQDGKGIEWRKQIIEELNQMGVIVFDPYRKPFEVHITEGPQEIKDNLARREKREYGKLNVIMREIRIYDLACVDKSDFIIAHINPTAPTTGSVEEIVTAVREKKPVFLSIEGGKIKCPLWYFGMFSHTYIFDSPFHSLRVLKQINDGVLPLDDKKWKLLRKEYR